MEKLIIEIVVISISALIGVILAHIVIKVRDNKDKRRLTNKQYGINNVKPLNVYRPIKGYYLGRFSLENAFGLVIGTELDAWIVYKNTYPSTFDFIGVINEMVVPITDVNIKKAIKIAALNEDLLTEHDILKYEKDNKEPSIHTPSKSIYTVRAMLNKNIL